MGVIFCIVVGRGVKEGVMVAGASVTVDVGPTVNVGGTIVKVGAASLVDGVGRAMKPKVQQQHIEMIDARMVMIFAVKPDFQKLAMVFMMFSLQVTGKRYDFPSFRHILIQGNIFNRVIPFDEFGP